jgi:anti-sigma regulatory factor (Ser/Thr protein kinase)
MPYRHEAMFYASQDALLEAGVPWLRDGLDAGDVIALACDAEDNDVLAAALGNHPAVRVLPQDRIYHKAVDAVAVYHDLVTTTVAASHARVRVLGEVGFGTSERALDEWRRFEAVCNHALAPLPLWSVCAYHTEHLPQSLIDTALATHPWLRTADTTAPNHDYVPPARLLNRAGPPLPPPNGEATTFALAEDGALREVRQWLRTRLDDLDTTAEAAETVVLAVGEVAGNGLRHGRPPVRVTLWVTPTYIMCDVTDRGPGFTDPLAGYTPPDPVRPAEHGAGLWVTRRLCDQVTTAQSRTGFTVRLAVTRGEPRPASARVRHLTPGRDDARDV